MSFVIEFIEISKYKDTTFFETKKQRKLGLEFWNFEIKL